jgi:CheY-like chemotaxis protein
MTELKRIVLAEDNPNDVELTLAALGEINLANEVVVVRDGAETLDYLCRRNAYANRAAGNPAVLLLDLKMPKVDGLDVLRALKADETLKTIPVVMLTPRAKSRTWFAAISSARMPMSSSRSTSGRSSTPSVSSAHSGRSSTNRLPAERFTEGNTAFRSWHRSCAYCTSKTTPVTRS